MNMNKEVQFDLSAAEAVEKVHVARGAVCHVIVQDQTAALQLETDRQIERPTHAGLPRAWSRLTPEEPNGQTRRNLHHKLSLPGVEPAGDACDNLGSWSESRPCDAPRP